MAVLTKKIKIKGEPWKFCVIESEAFRQAYGDSCAAITLFEQRTIQMPDNEISIATILHELFHAYASHLHLQSAEITLDQAEEIFAELFANHGVQMMDAALKITVWLSEKLEIKPDRFFGFLSVDQKKLLKSLLQKPQKQPAQSA